MTEDSELTKYFDEAGIQTRELRAKTLWEGGLRTNTLIRGFEIQSDEPVADFGSNSYAAPAEIFMGSLGACLTSIYAWSAFTFRLRLHAISTSITGTVEEVDGEARITRINVAMKVTAMSNKPDRLERCFEVAKKRCLILNSLDCEKNIEFKYKISEE